MALEEPAELPDANAASLLARGAHPDPFSVLGPTHDGRGVVAHVPGAERIWGSERHRPRRARSASGCPGGVRRIVAAVLSTAGAVAERPRRGTGGSVPLRPRDRRTGRVPDRRGHASPAVGRARFSRDHARGRRRCALRRVGAERLQGVGRRRLLLVGSRCPPHAGTRFHGGVGAVRAGYRRRRHVQVRPARPPRPLAAAEGGPGRIRQRTSSRRRRPWCADSARHDWLATDWDARRTEINRADAPISVYEVHLGSWRRRPNGRSLSYIELATELVDYAADLGFTHIEVMPVTEHPLRRIVGVPAGRPVRADHPERHAVGVRRLRRCGAFAGPGGDRRLGSRPLPHRRARARQVRRDGVVRAPRSARGLPPRLEHADLQLRPTRGARLPRRQRAVLDRRVPPRRTARRCRRLDAVSRLFARAGPMGAQSRRRARELRGNRLRQRGQPGDRTMFTPAPR